MRQLVDIQSEMDGLVDDARRYADKVDQGMTDSRIVNCDEHCVREDY